MAKVGSIDGLVRAMAKTAFTGRQLGEAADVLEAMALDEDAFVVMTLAGAMTVAKQGLIVADLIDRGIVERDRLHGRSDGPWSGGGHRPGAFPRQS